MKIFLALILGLFVNIICQQNGISTRSYKLNYVDCNGADPSSNKDKTNSCSYYADRTDSYCYVNAECSKKLNGECDWKLTSDLVKCLYKNKSKR